MHTLFLILISLFCNIIIAILGFVPSAFITAFNISNFGLLFGFTISLLGESLGAIISFYLYRKGLKKISQKLLNKHNNINRIINSDKLTQVKLVFSFRILPYMPSGLVTYAASISDMNIFVFALASTIGKIPAMIIEVLLVAGFLDAVASKNFTALLFIISIVIISFIFIKIFKNNNNNK